MPKCKTGCECRRHTNRPKLKPLTIRQMSSTEAAYVGAMLDAEGCVVKRGSGTNTWPHISIVNQNVEIISAIIRATGGGRVYNHHRAKQENICWLWVMARARNTYGLASQLAPYSMKAQKVLDWFEEKGGLLDR